MCPSSRSHGENADVLGRRLRPWLSLRAGAGAPHTCSLFTNGGAVRVVASGRPMAHVVRVCDRATNLAVARRQRGDRRSAMVRTLKTPRDFGVSSRGSIGDVGARADSSNTWLAWDLSFPRRGTTGWLSDAARWRWRTTSAKPRGSRSPRSPLDSVAHRRRSRPTSTTRSAPRRARSRRATGARAVAAARRRARGAARGTRTNTARAAVPGRSRGNGPASGSVRRSAPGARATALPRPPTTGRALTHAGAAANRSNDYKPENGPRRPHCHRSVRDLGSGPADAFSGA